MDEPTRNAGFNVTDRTVEVIWMFQKLNLDKVITVSIILLVLAIIVHFVHFVQLMLLRAKLTLTHLGSGNFLASPEERTVFEFARNEPFVLSGYINLKNMVEGDCVTIREYVKAGLDVDYTLYHEETYFGKQLTPILYISRRPAMRGIKITIQQQAGEPKYFQWEFYMSVV